MRFVVHSLNAPVGVMVISPVLPLQAKHCAGGMKNSLLQNEQVPKVVVQCLNNQLDTEIVCDSYIHMDWS